MSEEVKYQGDFQDAIDNLDQRSLLLAMALLGKRAMDILQVHKELEVPQKAPSSSALSK